MQRQKFNTLGGLNIQSTWCLECDSNMHTSSIAAPRYSDRKTLNNLLTLAKAQTSLFWSRLFATFRREWITPDIIVRANTRLTKWLESQQCFPTIFRLDNSLTLGHLKERFHGPRLIANLCLSQP